MKRARIEVEEAVEADMPAVAAIYGFYALRSLATFEESAPDLEEIRRRRRAATEVGLPFLVARLDARVAGFAYAHPYHERSAFRFTIEDSVYVSERAAGRGVGSALLGELLARCRAGPWRQMIAVVGDSENAASLALHRKFGFRDVGVLRDVGYKFGRWIDAPILQATLAQPLDAVTTSGGSRS